jgi:hypothetical protein
VLTKKAIYTHFSKNLLAFHHSFNTHCALLPLKNFWEKLPTIATARWNFYSKLIKSAREKRGRPAIFFQNIVDNCEDWDSL